ncbi:MAG: hypothetical protein AAGE85_06550 [Pseudomonadota bacterium]
MARKDPGFAGSAYSPPGGVLALLLMLASSGVGAEPEIHRCTQPDGTVAFQGTPCPEPAETAEPGDQQNAASEPEPRDDFFDFANPFDAVQEPPAPPADTAPAPVSGDRAECEKTTRDAIDAIDLEMRKGYTREEGQQYLAELLELTDKLRACKAL